MDKLCKSSPCHDSPHLQLSIAMSAVFSRQLDDFEQFSSLFFQWGGTFHQMSRGKFRGAAHVVNGQLLRVVQAETNQRILTRGVDNASYMTYIPITQKNQANVWQGRRLSEGHLILKGPEAEYHNQTNRDSVILMLLVPVQTMERTIRILTAKESSVNVQMWAAPRPPPSCIWHFQWSLATLLAASLRSPGILDGPKANALESECLRWLVDALVDHREDPVMRPGSSRQTILIKAAIDFMHDRLDKPLTALDLCAELQVNDRMLRRAFYTTFGMGPLTYFRLMRLHAARRALKTARGGNETVADIARRWAFHRLGSFAAEYRNQFGELPSETLGVRGWPGISQMARLQ